MALARDKVVRVEELSASVHFADEKPDVLEPYNRTELLKDGEIQAYVNGNLATVDREETSISDVPSEAEDKKPELPEGWPRLPQIFQRQSWNFSTAVSPSINKATSHLELLQSIIEQWCEDGTESMSSRVHSSSNRSRVPTVTSAGSKRSSKKPLQFNSTSSTNHGAVPKSALTLASGTSKTPSVDLAIRGLGAKVDAVQIEDVDPEGVYLGAEEVIEEVLVLLARLETDRQETLGLLDKERERVTMLGGQIDNLAEKRMLDLPAAVQKEHEACAMNIYELNWHVSYRGRNETRIHNKVGIAEVLNQRLKEDIDFVKSHVPLVQEKLELEQEAMARIQQAQTDTNQELEATLDRCSKVEAKSDEAHTKATEERAMIQRDLDAVRRDLARISEELAEAKMAYTAYIHQCNDYRQQLTDNEQELKVLQVKNDNAKTAESMCAAKVKDLQAKIVQEEFEHRRLQDNNTTLSSEYERNKSNHEHVEKELMRAQQVLDDKLRKLARRNQELDMDIEDAAVKVADCKKQKIADEKNLERMGKEMERTEAQIEVTLDDLANITIINNAVREQLSSQEDRCLQSEEALKSTVEGLRRQVKEEIHTKTIMAARMSSDSTELVVKQEENRQQQDQVDQKALEVRSALEVVQKKVGQLRVLQLDRSKTIADLKANLERLSNEEKKLDEMCTTETAELLPHHTSLKTELQELYKQLEYMDRKTEMMNTNLDNMQASAAMMARAYDSTSKIINQLQEEYDELQLQLEASQKLENELRGCLDGLNDRMAAGERTHRELMNFRKEVLQQHKADLEQQLKDNTKHASNYRHLTNLHIAAKNKLLNKYDDRNTLENAIKDVKQLAGLQQRMHHAMMEYYKYRGLYNKGELQRMEEESDGNAVKVGHLQTQMDGALDKISNFLQHQLDGDSIRRMAMEKVDREEREATAASMILGGNAEAKRELQERREKSKVTKRQSTNTSLVKAH